ncbi:hypothetical protein SAMN05444266_101519 [Chitinophaga jiangningensis]|uniref:Peptidylprolyl isomerase n=1 Tax=Chitinophaga jiangningensis TaxID=1419482 RepID=A0A1M6W8I0_9BACT|nr:hypothetical protein [Chitinophaga jiangningensis]SHK89795.1 hypothetical protein SAMN05444266_101519 [Chitinophaga jiangningensis]
MKQLATTLLLLIFGVFFMQTQAQNPTINIEGTSASIVSKLGKSLVLTDQQQPKLLTLVTNYLQQKSNIQALKGSNEKAYQTKLNSMQNGLNNKLKALLGTEQFNNYLSLKPAAPDATNVLTYLYY